MRGFLSSAAVALALAATSSHAQTGWQVEALIRGSGEPGPSRLIDTETRAAVRYAIVIGNAGYTSIPPLVNAIADARAMTDLLRGKGYEVKHYEDITKSGFEAVLRRALFDLDRDTEVVVFYAGHGFQIGSENYLVPVDADLDSVYDVPFEAVSLGSLTSIVGARARLQVVILDSCRDNPFAGKEALTQVGSELRETRTGFSSQAAPLNSFLVFSTSPGSVAFDGSGPNSPFTEALIAAAAATPDAPVKDVFETVRRNVWQATNGRQVPWDSSTLVEPASFGAGSARPGAAGTALGADPLSRSLVRVTPPQTGLPGQAQPAADVIARLELPYDEAIEVGPALAEALGTASSLRIVDAPRLGRLVDPGAGEFPRNVAGSLIGPDALARLVLVAETVEVPARSLPEGRLEDRVTVEIDGALRTVQLGFVPNACDFEAGDHLDPDGMGLTRYANEIRPERALRACEIAIAERPEIGRFHYQKGRALRALRRFDEARAAFETARDLGHARAWNALGNWELNAQRRTGGQFDERASDEVLRLYAQGVEAGDPYAYYSLGRQFLRYGENDEVEIEGYDLLMRSLEVGHTFAMNELGFFYLDEDSEHHDPERGLRYLRESAEREDIYGFHNMGLVHLRGLGGVTPDPATAYDYFLRAAEGGHPNAPLQLGLMLREGTAPGGASPARAVEWFLTGLERGDALSGGYGAHLIATAGPEGFQLYDGAVVAAKAAALTSQSAATRARDLLASFPKAALDAGAQALINELGTPTEIDGAFGPGSQQAMDAVLAEYGAGPAEPEAIDRLVQLASIYWSVSPFRVDLY